MPVRRASDRARSPCSSSDSGLCGGIGLLRYVPMRLRRLTFMQLQSFQPVQAMNALLPGFPVLTLEHDQHAAGTESWTVHRDLQDAGRSAL